MCIVYGKSIRKSAPSKKLFDRGDSHDSNDAKIIDVCGQHTTVLLSSTSWVLKNGFTILIGKKHDCRYPRARNMYGFHEWWETNSSAVDKITRYMTYMNTELYNLQTLTYMHTINIRCVVSQYWYKLHSLEWKSTHSRLHSEV